MEKFALLNLLKALETLSAPKNNAKNGQSDGAPPAPSADSAPREQTPSPEAPPINVMASVLERHEAMANRIKNNRR